MLGVLNPANVINNIEGSGTDLRNNAYDALKHCDGLAVSSSSSRIRVQMKRPKHDFPVRYGKG